MSQQPEPAPGTPGAVPVCPRHPDRESYVRCQRCEQPVCPECQRPAPVGVQCVDCVRQQARAVRTGRTVFGGQVGSQAPQVTKAILAICGAAYVLEWVLPTFMERFAFVPYMAQSEPWRFVTSAFLHAPPPAIFHILFNMYALWMVGPYLEALLGHVRFAALYLVSAIGGQVGVLVMAAPAQPWTEGASAWYGFVVGASGAIFGLFGALLLVHRKLGRDTAGIVGIIAVNGLIGFIPGWHIAWQAHLGGLITGTLVAAVYAYAPRDRRDWLHPVGLAAVALLLVTITMLKLAGVPAELLA